MKPSVGRIVHYKSTDESAHWNHADTHPAIITRVHSDTCVNLTVFPDANESVTRTSCVLGQQWEWPPRVEFE